MYNILSVHSDFQAQVSYLCFRAQVAPSARVPNPLVVSIDPSTSFSSLLRTSSSSDPQNEVDNNRKQQSNSQNRRAKAIIESALPSHANALCAPVECNKRVDHGHDGNECEEACADLSDAVTEVEKTDGEAAKDDGEVEP
jgi:hypothetical protein